MPKRSSGSRVGETGRGIQVKPGRGESGRLPRRLRPRQRDRSPQSDPRRAGPVVVSFRTHGASEAASAGASGHAASANAAAVRPSVGLDAVDASPPVGSCLQSDTDADPGIGWPTLDRGWCESSGLGGGTDRAQRGELRLHQNITLAKSIGYPHLSVVRVPVVPWAFPSCSFSFEDPCHLGFLFDSGTRVARYSVCSTGDSHGVPGTPRHSWVTVGPNCKFSSDSRVLLRQEEMHVQSRSGSRGQEL